MKVETEAAAVLTRVFPIRIVAKSVSTRFCSPLTSRARTEPFLPRYSSLIGLEERKAVSVEEKKALKRRKMKKSMSRGTSILENQELARRMFLKQSDRVLKSFSSIVSSDKDATEAISVTISSLAFSIIFFSRKERGLIKLR